MQDKIKEIQERLVKITPGIWNLLHECAVITGSGHNICYYQMDRNSEQQNYNTVDFIANAPTDVQFLLDALGEAQQRLHQHGIVTGVWTWWTYKCGHAVQQKYTEECPICGLKEAQAREQGLRDALEFYADEENYGDENHTNKINEDDGEIARQALAREETP